MNRSTHDKMLPRRRCGEGRARDLSIVIAIPAAGAAA